jgi:uncharacterized protein (TIRG00374 family)
MGLDFGRLAKKTGLWKWVLHFGVIAGVAWAAVQTLDGAQFRAALREFDWRFAPFVCALGVLYVLVKAWWFASLLRRTGEASRSTAIKAYVAGQSMTLLPGGVAARAGLLAQVGIGVQRSTPAILMSSVSEGLAFVVYGLLAAIEFEAARRPALLFLAIVGAFFLLLGLPATRGWIIGMIEKLLRRFGIAESWESLRANVADAFGMRVLALSVGNALVAFAALIAGLYLCLLAVGRPVSLSMLLLSFSIPTLIGRLSAIPGGFGLTEAGMVGVLAQAPRLSPDEATAAVLIFRVATVLFPALVGGVVYWTTWRREAERSQ